jgi:hypothetical protein
MTGAQVDLRRTKAIAVGAVIEAVETTVMIRTAQEVVEAVEVEIVGTGVGVGVDEGEEDPAVPHPRIEASTTLTEANDRLTTTRIGTTSSSADQGDDKVLKQKFEGMFTGKYFQRIGLYIIICTGVSTQVSVGVPTISIIQ